MYRKSLTKCPLHKSHTLARRILIEILREQFAYLQDTLAMFKPFFCFNSLFSFHKSIIRVILIIVHNRLSKFISQKQKGEYIEGIIIIFL